MAAKTEGEDTDAGEDGGTVAEEVPDAARRAGGASGRAVRSGSGGHVAPPSAISPVQDRAATAVPAGSARAGAEHARRTQPFR